MSKKIRLYFIPALLAVVALTQIIRTKTSHLSAWKGGGFGMFAVYIERTVACELIDENNTYRPCIVPFRGKGENGPLTITLKKSIFYNPSLSKLNYISDALFKSEMKVKLQDSSQKITINEKAVKALRLSIWDISFDAKDLTVRMDPLPGLMVEKGDWSAHPFLAIK